MRSLTKATLIVAIVTTCLGAATIALSAVRLGFDR